MGTAVLEQLTGALDDLLAADPVQFGDNELHQVVVELQRQSHRLAAVRAQLISVWDGRRLWSDDGSKSAGHRLSREASTSVRTAKAEVRRAGALTSMPHTAAALAAGALSADHVELLADANTGRRRLLFDSHEEMLVEQCKVLRFGDAYRLVEYWKQRADADTAEADGDRLHEKRGASAATTLDGMVDLRALLDPVGGAAFLAELNRIMEQLRLQDRGDGDPVRTAKQLRADAMVEMANRSRTARDGGVRPRPLITVLAGEETLARVCELANGTVIAPGQIVPLLADADIESIIFDGPRRVIGVSRRRAFIGALRRAIQVRDQRCQHPSGCDEPAERCDVDHIRPRCQGGETSQENGRIGCRYHNRIEKFQHAELKPPTSEPPPAGTTEPDRPDEERPDAPDGRSPPDGRAPPDAA